MSASFGLNIASIAWKRDTLLLVLSICFTIAAICRLTLSQQNDESGT